MTNKEIEQAEKLISLASKQVKPDHLEYWMCLAAARGKGTDKQCYGKPDSTY